jgi:alpha-tubulin suppressor-like RCC1 family protein
VVRRGILVMLGTGMLAILLGSVLFPGVAAASGQRSAGTSGMVYKWGFLARGKSTPQKVLGIQGTVVQVATSNVDSYALTSDGTVWAWGEGSRGELGDGRTKHMADRAVEVDFPPGVLIRSLADPMPYDSGLAIDTDGNAWGWGANHDGAFCSGSTEDELVPEEIELPDVTLVSGAGSHALYDTNGFVDACGDNQDGELGDGTTSNSLSPVAVVGLPDEPVMSLESSWQGSGALMEDGSYYDWGYNAYGQLGDGSTVNSATAVEVPLPLPAVQVAQGGDARTNGQSIALLEDGSIWTWGNNSRYQLGDGTDVNSADPVATDVPWRYDFSDVCSGGTTSYAIGSHGEVWFWGKDLLHRPRYVIPPRVLQSRRRFTEVSATAGNVAFLVRA